MASSSQRLQPPQNPGRFNADQPKQRRPRGKKLTFAEWVDSIRSKGEKAISDHKPIWDYAERAGLPADFIEIAWLRFKEKYLSGGGVSKTYVDWRAAFRDHVEGNYLGLWYWSDKDSQWRLTTAGVQADRIAEATA
jgi:hypothetical protein